ncbi:MAG: hypothetical protein C4321_11155, partial [Chloroflexota bacterium]
MSRDLAARGASTALVAAIVGFLVGLLTDGWGVWEVAAFALTAGLGAAVGYFAFWRPSRAVRTVVEAAESINQT